jgi:hypothetical protein
MKKYCVVSIALIALLSCEKKISEKISTQNSVQDSVVVSENAEPIESSTLQSCYLGISGKDSIMISLDDNLGTITGKMRYNNFEKDSSFGDIIGIKNGDTLKLNYTFQSEGLVSEREIYFLKKKDQLLEGIGDHKSDGNKDLYANPSKLKYGTSTLKQVDCKDFEKNFKIK